MAVLSSGVSEISMTPAASASLAPLNIFQLLGYTEENDLEKEAILTEAQLLLLSDVVENDLASQLPEEERSRLKSILSDEGQLLVDRLTTVLTRLKDNVPQLDDLLREKTAQMKLDVLTERMADMKTQFAHDAFASQQLAQADLWFHRENFVETLRILQAISARLPLV